MENVEIAEAVQVAQQARSDRMQITQDDVLRGLRREATLEGEGSSHAARVSAWGLIGAIPSGLTNTPVRQMTTASNAETNSSYRHFRKT